MKERLIVKNFGPIQHVDIELRRLTIFIGHQGTGKSTLAKLVAIFRDFSFVLSEIDNYPSWFANYNIQHYFQPDTYFEYTNSLYQLRFANKKLTFSKHPLFDTKDLLRSQGFFDAITRRIKNDSVYIPAERFLIASISEASMDFFHHNVSLPKSITSFGRFFQAARKEVQDIYIDFLKVGYSFTNGRDLLKLGEEQYLNLSEGASGMQSVVPLYVVMEHLSQEKDKPKTYVVEEPELNLYPSAQKRLLEFLLQKCSPSDHLVITTHSPYVITSLNNCLKAHLTAKSLRENQQIPDDEKENLLKAVDQIVAPAFQWDFQELSAYFIDQDGSIKDIRDEDYKLINADPIDLVSEEIDQQFDSLLDIQYQYASTNEGE